MLPGKPLVSKSSPISKDGTSLIKFLSWSVSLIRQRLLIELGSNILHMEK